MAYQTISSHARMALDSVRNDAYAHALRWVIGPDSVVLDLGAGTGVFGLMAARMGARRVYLVEPTDVLAVAQEIVNANGLQDVVQCLHGRLEDVVIPEPVDVIVSVMTGNFLVSEDLLPILFDARDRLLKPDGHLVPSAAVMEATLVSAPPVYAANVECWRAPQHGVDLSAARPYAANSLAYGPDGIRDATFMADPAELLTLDFRTSTYDAVRATLKMTVTMSGVCDGIAGWFRMQLGDRWLSTSPRADATHWSTVYMPVDPPVALEKGEHVTLQIDRQPKGDWAWRLRTPHGARKHSTLLSAPMSTTTLEKASTQYVPPVNADVAATAVVLSCIDGSASVDSIASSTPAAISSWVSQRPLTAPSSTSR